MSLRDKILEGASLEVIPVTIGGERVHMQEMTGAQAETFAKFISDAGGDMPEHLMATALVQQLFDPENGERIFSDSDKKLLSETLSAVELKDLFSNLMELSGITEEEEDGKNG